MLEVYGLGLGLCSLSECFLVCNTAFKISLSHFADKGPQCIFDNGPLVLIHLLLYKMPSTFILGIYFVTGIKKFLRNHYTHLPKVYNLCEKK